MKILLDRGLWIALTCNLLHYFLVYLGVNIAFRALLELSVDKKSALIITVLFLSVFVHAEVDQFEETLKKLRGVGLLVEVKSFRILLGIVIFE